MAEVSHPEATHISGAEQRQVGADWRSPHLLQIAVSLRTTRSDVALIVRDGGIGIDADAENAAGCGQRFRRHRARVLGGTLQVQRRDEGGTIVTCLFPWK